MLNIKKSEHVISEKRESCFGETEIVRERTIMATLTVPHPVPPVADDCEKLRKAFQGLSLYISCVHIVRLFKIIFIYLFFVFQLNLGHNNISIYLVLINL